MNEEQISQLSDRQLWVKLFFYQLEVAIPLNGLKKSNPETTQVVEGILDDLETLRLLISEANGRRKEKE
jgi:hypothetical protein